PSDDTRCCSGIYLSQATTVPLISFTRCFKSLPALNYWQGEFMEGACKIFRQTFRDLERTMTDRHGRTVPCFWIPV
ncbi:MAG: hypothetical protein ACLPXB_06745, partial [Thiobacillaceae bacterium]